MNGGGDSDESDGVALNCDGDDDGCIVIIEDGGVVGDSGGAVSCVSVGGGGSDGEAVSEAVQTAIHVCHPSLPPTPRIVPRFILTLRNSYLEILTLHPQDPLRTTRIWRVTIVRIKTLLSLCLFIFVYLPGQLKHSRNLGMGSGMWAVVTGSFY